MSAKCDATVWKRDIPRYTGRGKSGFERDWVSRQCQKVACCDALCTQHAQIARRFPTLVSSWSARFAPSPAEDKP